MKVRTRYLPPGWYPGSAAESEQEIKAYITGTESIEPEKDAFFGGIVPHAGWFFSGKLAARVFNLVAKGEKPDVVAIFGGHLGAGSGIIYMDDAWETPWGPMPLDLDLAQELHAAQKPVIEQSATNDNTVEIQIPLAKYFFPDSKLVALRAPHSPLAESLGKKLAEIAVDQGKSLRIFGSTDLTHYGPNYGFSPKGSGDQALGWVKEENDKGFVDMAVAMNSRGLLGHAARNMSACSAGAAAAAISACQAMGSTKGQLVDYYTSADIQPGSSFVGYAGIVY